jgi:hypothetical protein
LALKAWPVLQKSSLYARWMLNWPRKWIQPCGTKSPFSLSSSVTWTVVVHRKKDKDKRIYGRNISPKFSCWILMEFSQTSYGKFQSFVSSFVSLRIRSELCELTHSLPPWVLQKSVV